MTTSFSYLPINLQSQVHTIVSVSRFETGTLHTQLQQQYVRENGCARSVVCAVRSGSLRFSGFLSLTRSIQPERTQRTPANSRRTALRAQPFSRTSCRWRCVCNVPVSNLDTLTIVLLSLRKTDFL